ncbi:unnamed protein product [Amoebophrya sp. A120]|nr:unnamed protein product [Amoebophrya sp. A120]|eukprot:GSA120T00010102001.1
MTSFISTRDTSTPPTPFTFQQAIELGYAPDGGLFVPETFHAFTATEIRAYIERIKLKEKDKDQCAPPATTGEITAATPPPLTYAELAFDILKKFIREEEIPRDDLREICEAAMATFAGKNTTATSSTSHDGRINAVPVKLLKTAKHPQTNIHVAELFHGPTFCFKDFGQQFTIRLLEYFAFKEQKSKLVIVSTTGDTGPAALRAVADAAESRKEKLQARRSCSGAGTTTSGSVENEKDNLLSIIVSHPEGQISNLQRRQMTTVFSSAVKTCVFQGGGDDLDDIIKKISLENSDKVTGVNSYNIGRPIAQIVHYFWSYLQVTAGQGTRSAAGAAAGDEKGGKDPPVTRESKLLPPVDFAVPSGALGNLTAGWFAKKLGLPVKRFITGTNVNDITFRTFTTGKFQKAENMVKNLAEAMNIQVPYNFERLLYYAATASSCGETAAHTVQRKMEELERTNKYELVEEVFAWFRENGFSPNSYRISDEEIVQVIREAASEEIQLEGGNLQATGCEETNNTSMVLCPHSACGVRAAWNFCDKEKMRTEQVVQEDERHYGDKVIEMKNTGADTASTKTTTTPDEGVPIIVLATASWCKFEEVVEQAFGTSCDRRETSHDRTSTAASGSTSSSGASTSGAAVAQEQRRAEAAAACSTSASSISTAASSAEECKEATTAGASFKRTGKSLIVPPLPQAAALLMTLPERPYDLKLWKEDVGDWETQFKKLVLQSICS